MHKACWLHVMIDDRGHFKNVSANDLGRTTGRISGFNHIFIPKGFTHYHDHFVSVSRITEVGVQIQHKLYFTQVVQAISRYSTTKSG